MNLNNSVVYKFKLDVVTMLILPLEAEVLSAGVQRGDISLWVHKRTFYVIPTRMPHKLHLAFIQTVMMKNGALVFHIFEEV